ncbi:MAG TPA: outer membrane beta-barrel protein [Sphingobacterium sp.]|nr:outer membrane beta-barrel protein [Sphingobacterium sp.]
MPFLYRFFLLIFCLIYTSQLVAQSEIKGQVIDEEEEVALENATIVILQQQDSILKDFARTDEKGLFKLSIADTNDYILMISYPKYADFTKTFNAAESQDFGKISLQTAAHLIEEVVVTGRLPVVIKGDTIEYDADSFTVEKNAKVEDLLKVMPGITVDSEGKITAQGKTVEKVLVDGEEFFGDDPTLVTRNVRSDMVDKVQVYEKQSEETERTGVDDGERIQTINVELKEDAKNGVFGKATAGGATDEYYTGQLMLNKFKGSQKIGAFMITGNNGTTGLSWSDAQKYGGGSMEVGDDGGISISGGDDFGGWGGEYQGSGIPNVLNTGINFTDKWNGDKNKINLGYLYGKINANGESERLTQNNLEDRTLFNAQNALFENDKNRHQFNLKYDLKIDSLTTLTVTGSASKWDEWNSSTDSSYMTDREGITLNDQYRHQVSDDSRTSVDFNGYLTRKFHKEGRSISLRVNYRGNESNGNQFLNNRLNYYSENGEIETSSITDQEKKKTDNSSYTMASIAYTEPLSKQLNLSLSYGITNNGSNSMLYSYNKDGGEDYSQLDSLYSSDFDYRTLSSNYNVSLNFKSEKFRVNFTNLLKNDQLKQENNFTQDKTERSFLTYNPSVNVTYNISKNSHLRVGYRGTNSLPSLSQIQPLRNNEDELNVYLGNESLKPQFNHNYSLNFQKYNALEGAYMYGGVSFSQNVNPLTLNAVTDDYGRSTYQWENLTDKSNRNANMYIGKGVKLIREWDLDFDISGSVNYNDQYNFINSKLNNAKYMTYSIRPGIRRTVTSGLNISLYVSPGYSKQKTTLQPEFDNSGFTLQSNNNIKYYFPKQFELFTEIRYVYEAPTATFDEKFERLIINPGVSKKILRDESLKISFLVNDLLNQNVGFRRSQNGNVFTQNSYDTIRRYYMLRVSWDFNKMFNK